MNQPLVLAGLFAASLLAVNSSYVQASEETGSEEALKECRVLLQVQQNRKAPSDTVTAVEYGLCRGYLQGYYDTIQMEEVRSEEVGQKPLFCFPKRGASVQEMAEAYVAFMEENPALLQEHRIVTTYKAFLRAYPCDS